MLSFIWIDLNELNNANAFEMAYSLLSVKKKEEFNQIKNEERAKQALASGLLLRYALRENNLLALYDKTIRADNGKPVFPDNSLHFNISHAKNMAICVYGKHAVGCDTEWIGRKLPDNMKRIFSKEEQAYYYRLKDYHARQTFFFQIWTRKEALSKWSGEGIRLDFSKISLVSDDSAGVVKRFFYEKELFFQEFFLNEYIISICSEKNNFSIIPQKVNMDTIFL